MNPPWLFLFLISLCSSAMITEPALNSQPDHTTRISSSDLPIRIEGALQEDYFYSDWYYISAPLNGWTEDKIFYIYLYDGCEQTCQQQIQVTVQNKVMQIDEKTCLVGAFSGRYIPIQLSEPRERLKYRYGLVITSSPRGSITPPPTYNISCTPYFKGYNYQYPLLPPSTNLTTCYEPAIQGHSSVFMGPFTSPTAVNFKMTTLSEKNIVFSIDHPATYHLLLREGVASPDLACDTKKGTWLIKFDLYFEDERINQIARDNDISDSQLSLSKPGLYRIRITRNFKLPAGVWPGQFPDETYLTLFLFSSASPFAPERCDKNSYQGPCRQYYPPGPSPFAPKDPPSRGIDLHPRWICLMVMTGLLWVVTMTKFCCSERAQQCWCALPCLLGRYFYHAPSAPSIDSNVDLEESSSSSDMLNEVEGGDGSFYIQVPLQTSTKEVALCDESHNMRRTGS